jgi:steroid 5-alpha reductase family enzyme
MTEFMISGILPASWLSGYDTDFQNLVTLWMTLMLTVAALCFVISEITRNYSQVDKLWSLLPPVYSWVTVAAFPSVRAIIMAVLVTMWGLRLSYNFHRKGGYNIIPWKGEEDYRWKILRESKALRGRLRFGLFNLLFISLYQNIIILLFTTPILLAALHYESLLSVTDIVAALLMLIFLITETVADNQQFRFQALKRSGSGGATEFRESLHKGFLTEGLWKYVRHPNFASEQAIWISFYLFGVAASGNWINCTLAGPVLLVLLFLGSSIMTEKISSSKYPEYSAYQKEVPKFIPRIFRRK